jgi:hypothetical protein
LPPQLENEHGESAKLAALAMAAQVSESSAIGMDQNSVPAYVRTFHLLPPSEISEKHSGRPAGTDYPSSCNARRYVRFVGILQRIT